jgi:hypothetical protein
MPYKDESSNKISHIDIPRNALINKILSNIEIIDDKTTNEDLNNLEKIRINELYDDKEIKVIYAVDGSINKIEQNSFQKIDGLIIKTGTLLFNIDEYKKITDLEFPTPMITESFLNKSFLSHSTFLIFKNLKYKNENFYNSIRRLIYDSYALDDEIDKLPLRTLKFFVYRKWRHPEKLNSELFECPCCNNKISLPYDSDEYICGTCSSTVYITDFVGFHKSLSKDSKILNENIGNEYMLFHEAMILFSSIIQVYKKSMENKKDYLKSFLFIKDGPLSMNSIYAKMISYIREFFKHVHNKGYKLNLVGQEKTGNFVEYFKNESNNINEALILTSDFIRSNINPSNGAVKGYGFETLYGSKVYFNKNNTHRLVLTIPTQGNYLENPKIQDFNNLKQILACVTNLITYKYENGLYPLSMINNKVSISNSASSSSLQSFINSYLEKL